MEWRMVATGVVSVVFVGVGWRLVREAERVLKGGEPKDPVSFKALARYPSGDFGEHWKKKDQPELVRVLGWFLVLAGVCGIVQTVWQVVRRL